MHIQLGPVLKAMVLSGTKDPFLKSQLEKKIDSNPFDVSISTRTPTRKCIFSIESDDDGGSGVSSSIGLDLPKTDLIAELPSDIVKRLVRTTSEDYCVIFTKFSNDGNITSHLGHKRWQRCVEEEKGCSRRGSWRL